MSKPRTLWLWPWRLAPAMLMFAGLASTHCSSGDAPDYNQGVGGTITMGDPLMQSGGTSATTTGMGGTAGSSTASATGSSSQTGTETTSTTSAPFGGTTTTGMTATGAGASGATTSSAGGVPSTGFMGMGGGTTSSGEQGGSGGQGAGGTTMSGSTMGGSGGTVAPGETGVFEGTVAAHNQARAAVDVMPPLDDLVWSEALAEVAQDWADTLTQMGCGNISHRPNGQYGENIAMRGNFGGGDLYTGPEAVAAWVAEIDCYSYGTIGQSEQCDQACIAQQNSSGCGHYTQVVWSNTEEVGCGYSSCDSGNFTYEVIVCNYDPPGNYIGQTPY